MADTVIPDDLLALLRAVDTPTVCNAIEVVQGKRGFNRFTRGTMQHSKPGDPATVGFARTAKISGLAPRTRLPTSFAPGAWSISVRWLAALGRLRLWSKMWIIPIALPGGGAKCMSPFTRGLG